MKLLRGFEEPSAYRGGYVSIGNYDGVHRGHQAMLSVLVNRARSANVPAVVLTFDPHPIQVLRPDEAPPRLSTLTRKAELLERCGVDCLIAYPADRSFLQLTPDEFFEKFVRRELQARGLVEGENFFFGRGRSGNVHTLKDLCAGAQLECDVVAPVIIGDDLVSSSRIRWLISEGHLDEVAELLGHPYRIRGRVASGAGRGTGLGFPTANLCDVETLVPGEGVYAGLAHRNNRVYAAAIHHGANPTFREDETKLEVHLIGFTGDVLGEELDVDLLGRIRGIRTFESAEDLRRQLNLDLQKIEEMAQQALSRLSSE